MLRRLAQWSLLSAAPAICFISAAMISPTAFAESPKAPAASATEGPVWIAIYDHSGGSAKGPKNLERFLNAENGFRSERLTPEEIRAGRLKAFDLLIMPGGSGSLQSRKLQETGLENVREFVKKGGGYCGICAGSYLASSDYTWSLHLLNAKVFDRAHWARGTGDVTLTLSDTGKELLKNDSEDITVYYGQGPLLIPDTKEDLPAYEPLAEYATEIAKKGAPSGVMIGTTAIARAPYGSGRVICFSPHPESRVETEHLIREGILWAVGRDATKSPESNEESEAETTAAGAE
ncbi:MAG: BPL-N domain-containing protein [Rubinisphaera brasiliensis]|uniref:Biotin apo-protein ligase-related protein n=1 Tax=Rubinisphaera brasiliensis (strain ATCC 49424 / DSM 5305 / JCM 21570 / IAM 15109 / NBRC 103401 / IFAM 1448) TaxID=756272 RepID=F0SI21_RUBBR|nr:MULTISPECIES: BPL-N domain-containing protein [Rubinisphaera]ADY60704.1 biotin apo-protein ligase-related protein [Rubinisphaera brasiliensis DSM 5305]MBR9801336.1 biofilm PGA synthesis protein PgaC [bacterium]